jgi:hypothetical protein
VIRQTSSIREPIGPNLLIAKAANGVAVVDRDDLSDQGACWASRCPPHAEEQEPDSTSGMQEDFAMNAVDHVANFNGQRPVIDPGNAVLLLIDHQSGLFQTA